MSNTIALRVDRLRALREQRGWSQRQLARHCGLGDTVVNKYERGVADPSATTLKIIAEKLGVSADYLLGLTDDPAGLVGAELSEDERAIVQAFRRNSWQGVILTVGERMNG